MTFLEQELSALESYLTYADRIDECVSQVSVGRHIEHSLLALKEIMHQCLASNPEDYKRSFNIMRYIVLWSGFIPRGRAKAPDFTIPKEEVSLASLQAHLSEVKELLPAFVALTDNRKHCLHPFFGMLNLTESKRNCAVHTRHHLKIIKDIVG